MTEQTWKTVHRPLYRMADGGGKYVTTGETISAEAFAARFPEWKCHLRLICDPEERIYYAPAGDGLTFFAIIIPVSEIFFDDRIPERYIPADCPTLETKKCA